MHIQVLYLLLFCLSFGEYDFYGINTDQYEALFNDFGRQFFNGLCITLDGTQLLGIECDNGIPSFGGRNMKSYSGEKDVFHPMVTVDPLGTAVGIVMETYTGKPFYGYMGIRYGTAETFEMPQMYEEPWENDFLGGFDATYARIKCSQRSSIFPVASGDEDCLFINIYTPELDEENPTKIYPVMVFIHGGGYGMGDASLYVPSRLIEEDVIVVVLQYRLGSLGFLYSATTSAPGNMGLMDQITALKWVNKYISYFNGDENRITVFGESAGSTSASWMQFTPQTSAAYNDGNQLLDRIICQSGSALDVWTLDPDYKKSIILHGQATDCYEETYTSDDIVACMKELPVDELVDALSTVAGDSIANGGLGFSGVIPVVQDELAELLQDEALIRQYIVIPNHPLDMLADGNFNQVDVLAGSNRDEGLLFIGRVHLGIILPNGLGDDENFFKYEALPLIVASAGIEDTTGAVANSFRLSFFRNAEMGNATDMMGGMIDLSGMLFFKSGPWKLAQSLTLQNPDNDVFFYSFEFESEDSLFDWLYFSYPDMPFEGGVCHADDLLYLFAMISAPDDRESLTIKRMTTLWSNFAYYGDPTPDDVTNNWVDLNIAKWKPYSFTEENILIMADEFVASEDFVLRWNYNTL